MAMKTQNALAGQFLDMGRLRKHKLPWQGQISAQPLGLLNSIGGIKEKQKKILDQYKTINLYRHLNYNTNCNGNIQRKSTIKKTRT